MAVTAAAKEYHEKMFPGYRSKFLDTDPEFIERFDNFAFDEVVNSDDLDGRTRMTAILAVLIGCQGIDEYRAMLPAALNFGVTPAEAKEMLYQGTAYLGIGRVFPFLHAANEIIARRGVALPLPPAARTTAADRFTAGARTLVEIFGDGMKDFGDSGAPASRHINRWLTANCFGDWYTRGGLDLRRREMITFCFLAAQGGCEKQLAAHVAANLRLGNGRDFLIKVVSQCIPFIGYPRALNALDCVNETAGRQAQKD
ncbi:MAG: carboxymuconolactone decarboxylase family protein [bacterium]|nr:carboxymuconolactone decarboxylase family protein [bacterium]